MKNLRSIIKFLNGITLMTDLGINLSIETSMNFLVFKKESNTFVDAYMTTIKDLDQIKDEKEIAKLLEKEYKITMPIISIEELKGSAIPVPLKVFDFISEQIKS